MTSQTCIEIPKKKKTCDEIEVTSRLLNIIFDMPMDQQLDLLKHLDKSGYDGSRRYARKYLKPPWIVLIDPEKNTASSYNDFIKNISRCGMFIETARSFLVGENIIMKFQVPSSKKLYTIRGEIVRFQDNGIGIKFKQKLSGS